MPKEALTLAQLLPMYEGGRASERQAVLDRLPRTTVPTDGEWLQALRDVFEEEELG